ncbi:bifunctional UDP-N-acetylglucosamine diphosphorylase/glucosamine-1-phosphate N-acetyltransferase GlmU [Gordonia alkaliphila]|uniref:bifunctional UDP-N-acetylglucosamine diphosphorylase/glucosamine-1-phosphate N-acetyltransferase GlmU n=1 Tax=Gordonia alkaliphila TaxID=1053547 RepID=UPI001FF11B9D|nr:bifunctional UDP-N-acetylglucosamine diphosphorylase/glucosamine-1-phosphate N-acetyltransferase GlmU [Gordonia alkaliphila]MCK0439773.1 bifunctional UDP-N-acetylglucosamine diphosphorylase/glucosamine-1-phosphate N-acetyltransferase GlmU [Gordonia alkaliphila]
MTGQPSGAYEPDSAYDEQLAVIVLAAGAGTRMKSKTPKILHRIAGRSLVHHALAAAHEVAPAHVIPVVSHEREKVTAEIERVAAPLGDTLKVAVQDRPLGTGDAARAGLTGLPDDFTGTVLITVADAPLLDGDTLRALIATHTAQPAAAVTLTSFTVADPAGYGRIERTDGEVTAIVEHKDATAVQLLIDEVNAGIYAFDAAVLREALRGLSTDNAQGEFYLTDVVQIAREAGRVVRAHIVDDPAVVAGCNDRAQLAELAAELNRRIVRRHQLAGVNIVDPATTWIDVDVTIGRDAVIEPGTQLRGRTEIGDDAVVGPDTTLTDVTIGAGAQVVRTHGSEAVVGAGATVGPFAFLRPGTRLGKAGKIGAYVETKNAQIGTGTKIPHLTYVGDAEIGEYTNIGASSVFVNYDGEKKHRTVIGSHCRTGSDNMFVAPVTLGDGVYTGAGTVVRQDVPSGALAVSAGPQRIIEDWVLTKRPTSAAAQAAQAARESASQEESSS